ncbi:MAG: vWA domain-containing protein [Gemmataceae bacterium]
MPGWFWGGLVGTVAGVLFGGVVGVFVGKAIWSGDLPQHDPVAAAPVGVEVAKVKVMRPKFAADTTKLDVMFVVDVTGSMNLPGIQDGVVEFQRLLTGEKADARFGLTVFRDGFMAMAGDGINGDPWTFTWRDGSSYTNNIDELRETLSRIRAEGGDDAPENSFEGLRKGAEAAGRFDAQKVLILITDDAPKPWPVYQDNLRVTKTFLQDKNVRQLHIIGVPAYRNVYEELWNPAIGPGGRPILSGRWTELNMGFPANLSGAMRDIKTKMLELAR